ncbi:hypothetical protein D3C76_744960 [compost metagenome]
MDIHDIHQRSHCGRIVGQRLGQARQAGLTRVQPRANQAAGEHQQARRGDFLEIMLLQAPESPAERHETPGQRFVDPRLADQDVGLHGLARVVEAQCQETLASARLHPLQQVLVAGVVGHHQHERGRCLQAFTGALQMEFAAIVGQRVDHHSGVLARLDHFVEIADTALPHGAGKWSVLPPGAIGTDQVASDQIGGAQVVMAGHGMQRQLQTMRHVLHEAGLAAAGRPLEQYRQAMSPGLFEELHLIPHG